MLIRGQFSGHEIKMGFAERFQTENVPDKFKVGKVITASERDVV